jgi:tellurite resistance protein
LVAWIVHVMTADDRIEGAELALLPSLAARHNVSESDLAHLVSAAQAGELDLTPPHNAEEASEWLATAVEMAMADGDISPQEKDAMYTLGKRLGLGKKKMNGIINGTRKRLRHQQKDPVA